MQRSNLAVVIMAVGALMGPSRAGGAQIGALSSDLASQVVSPRVEALRTAFHAQYEAWQSGCSQPEVLRAAFHTAADAWASVEIFKSGPLSRQSRAERIAYWPDPRNGVEKGLKSLLGAPDETALSPEAFANASVAVQGLPALERVLFAEDSAGSSAPGPLAARACAVGRAIARNLDQIASAVASEWGPYARDLASAAPDSEKAREQSAAALTDLATGLRILEERKAPPVFDAKVPANPHAAQWWRSGRSERDLAMNIGALQAAFALAKAYAPQAAGEAASKLSEANEAIAASDGPNRAIAVLAAINNAKYYAIEVMPTELGIALGFNSLDGD